MIHLEGNDERAGVLYKLKTCPASLKKLRGIRKLTVIRMRNGEVAQIRAGARGGLHPRLQSPRRRLVQAEHWAELLLGRQSLGVALRYPQVTVCPPVRAGSPSGERRDEQRHGGAERREQKHSGAEEHGDLREGHFPKHPELRTTTGRREHISVQSRRLPVPGLAGLLHLLLNGAQPPYRFLAICCPVPGSSLNDR